MKPSREVSDITRKAVETKIAQATPPNDKLAEDAYLGAVLRRWEVLDEVERLPIEAFYSARNRVLYAAMLNVHRRNDPVDCVTLGDELSRLGKLMEIGGAETIIGLWDGEFTSAFASKHAAIIRECWRQRQLIGIGVEIVDDSYRRYPATDVINAAETHLSRISQAANAHIDKIATLADNALSELAARKEGRGQIGSQTGIYKIDGMTGGIKPGQFWVIAARPSVGKSALALQIAGNLARRERGVFFASLEMSDQELTERLLASIASVDADDLRKGFYSSADLDAIAVAHNTLSDYPLWVYDCPGATIPAITAAVAKTKSGSKIEVVIIDYLQLAEPTERGQNRVEQVTEISRACKKLARKLGVAVIALSQLSREVEKRGGRPRLSDLRDSGAIEQDADVVLFLHRDKPDSEVLEAILAKQRNGPIGLCMLHFNKRTQTIGEMTDEAPPFTESNGDF